MPTTAPTYAHRFDGPEVVARSDGAVLTCPVYDGDALVEPDDGTITLTLDTGSALVSGVAVTITGDTAQYTLSAAAIASAALSTKHMIQWDLVFGDHTLRYRQQLWIVRCVPTQAATHGDLAAFRTDLVRSLRGTGQTTLQAWLDESWRQLTRWLLRQGSRPHLVVEPWELKELHLAWAYWHFCADMADRSPPESDWRQRRDDAAESLKMVRSQTAFTYDMNDTGTPQVERIPARGPLFLTALPGAVYEAGDWRFR